MKIDARLLSLGTPSVYESDGAEQVAAAPVIAAADKTGIVGLDAGSQERRSQRRRTR